MLKKRLHNVSTSWRNPLPDWLYCSAWGILQILILAINPISAIMGHIWPEEISQFIHNVPRYDKNNLTEIGLKRTFHIISWATNNYMQSTVKLLPSMHLFYWQRVLINGMYCFITGDLSPLHRRLLWTEDTVTMGPHQHDQYNCITHD